MKFRTVLIVVFVFLLGCFIACDNSAPTPQEEIVESPYGKISYRGSSESAPSNPEKYDVYFNTTDGCTYIYDGTTWMLMALKGDKGDTGATGAQGAKGDTGEKGEKGEQGAKGLDGKSIIWKGSYSSSEELTNPQEYWAYYNTSKGSSYVYSNGSWTLLAQSGTSITWKGTLEKAPENSSLYDAYYNTTDGCSYIYDGTGWVLLASKGAKGDTGATGEKGDKGDTGANGQSIAWKGTLASHPENPEELWTYYNSTDGNAYIFSNGTWQLLIENLSVNYDTPTIIGTIKANNDYYSVADTYVKVVDEATNETVWNNKPATDGDFAVSALNAEKKYTIYFSSKRLSDVNITVTRSLTSNFCGTFGAIRTGVSPVSGKAKDVGDVVLTPNGKITGKVTLSDGSTPQGIDVYLNNTSYATTTSLDGSYTLSDIVQGTYVIVYSKDGYSTVSKNVIVYSSDLETDPSVSLSDVKLVIGTSNISGVIGYGDKTDASGINVLLINSEGVTVKSTLTSTTDGKFSFSSINPGTYTIRAKADGYTTFDKSIAVTEGESYVLSMGNLVNLCGTIKGKVTMNDLSTGSSVKVSAVCDDGIHSYETITDSNGEYTIKDVFYGKYALSFSKEEYVTASAELSVEHGKDISFDVEMKSRYGYVIVTVGYADNTNPEGILVSAYKGSTLISAVKSSSTGVVTISKLEPSTDYHIVASCDGYSSVEVSNIAVSTSIGTEVNLGELSNKYGSINGVVVEQSNSPIKDAVVTLTRNDGAAYTIFTDDSGCFSKSDVAVGIYSITVTKDGFIPATLESKYSIESAKETKINDSIMLYSKYATINGIVLYSDMSDASNISVTIENSSGIIASKTTSTNGLFNFSVEAGTYTIRANAIGYEESTKEISVLASTTYAPTLDSLISKYGIISGKVLDGDLNSIEGATILISGDNGCSYSSISLADGSFTERVLVGNYSISIRKVDYKTTIHPLAYTVSASNTTTVEETVLTSEFSLINAKVTLGDSVAPEGVTVVITDSNGTSVDTATTGTDGAFKFRVGNGTYTVKASKDGYTAISKEITVVSGKTYSLDMGSLKCAYGTVKGKVVDSSGNAVTGAVITVTNMDGSVSPYTLSSNESGEFSSSTILVGSYTLSITKSGYVDVVVNSIPVIGGSTYDVGTKTMVIGSAGITGRVILEGVTNYTGVTVTAISTSDSTKVYTTTTAEDGSYYFLSLDSDTYSIKLQKEGFLSDSTQQVSLSCGEISSVRTVTLKNESSTLTGTAVLAGGADYTGIQVLVMDTASTTTFSTTTDRNGKYIINNVTTGTYELIFSKDGYGSVTVKDVQIGKGEEKTLDSVSLEIAYTSVKGKITLEEATDYSGTLITATNISNTELIYSAITNSDGNFTLAKMYAGEYSIVVSRNSYLSATLPTVTVKDDTPIDCGTTELTIAKGEITGLVRLEGYSDFSGIKVSLLGTGKETTTAKDGSYSFTVPAGNYSGGIRYEYDDFETTSYATNIAVLPTTSYSDAYVVPDIEMKCLRIPKISGKVTIYGLTKAQYDNITITIAELPKFTYTTGEDGTYFFEHVPVGTYTFEFTRENARKVTKIVTVEAAPEIKIENIELIPDAVTLYGNISLKGVADYSGVTVRITTPDSVELKTVTNAAGYWYISNIVASKSHTITFEKTGWESQAFEIVADAYAPLSETNYNDEHLVALVDKVAPVITALTVTVGKSTEEGREIYLYLYTQEEGSGVKYIQGNTSDSFDDVTEQEYYNPFKLIIPDELGEKTIYVRIKDAAGNISSTVSTNVVLKNDKTELSSVLNGDKLHLTKANSPYLMTDNVLVPSGETLIIDPGVVIQINGAYYIQVEGTLTAVGTADERIKIYATDYGEYNYWWHINILNDSGSKIAYADISGIDDGICGYCDIDNSIITAYEPSESMVYGFALGSKENSKYFYGSVTNSNIFGNIYACPTHFENNTITARRIYLNSNFINNNEFSGELNGSITGCLIQNTFSGTGWLEFNDVYMRNSKIDVSRVEITNSIVKYTTFNNATLSITDGSWARDAFNNCQFDSSYFSVTRLNYSNFIGCGKIQVSSARSTLKSINMQNNYWGDVNTVELDQKTENDKVSFLYHYPDNFNRSRIDWSSYSKTALLDCGYQGSKEGTTGSYSGYQLGDEGPAGGIVFYDKGYYSDGWRYLEAATTDLGSYVFGYYRLSDGNNYEVGTSQSIGTGKYNTDDLIKAMDIEGKAYSSSIASETTTSEYAARKCYDYESGGYSDWFLPSMNELKLLYQQKNVVGISSGWYWSSSEKDSSYAWYQNFDYGYQGSSYRDLSYYVRPIRAF